MNPIEILNKSYNDTVLNNSLNPYGTICSERFNSFSVSEYLYHVASYNSVNKSSELKHNAYNINTSYVTGMEDKLLRNNVHMRYSNDFTTLNTLNLADDVFVFISDDYNVFIVYYNKYNDRLIILDSSLYEHNYYKVNEYSDYMKYLFVLSYFRSNLILNTLCKQNSKIIISYLNSVFEPIVNISSLKSLFLLYDKDSIYDNDNIEVEFNNKIFLFSVSKDFSDKKYLNKLKQKEYVLLSKSIETLINLGFITNPDNKIKNNNDNTNSLNPVLF